MSRTASESVASRRCWEARWTLISPSRGGGGACLRITSDSPEFGWSVRAPLVMSEVGEVRCYQTRGNKGGQRSRHISEVFALWNPIFSILDLKSSYLTLTTVNIRLFTTNAKSIHPCTYLYLVLSRSLAISYCLLDCYIVQTHFDCRGQKAFKIPT